MVRCIKGIEHGVKREKTEDGGQRTEFRILNCGLRNREPARRVGVRRTISKLEIVRAVTASADRAFP